MERSGEIRRRRVRGAVLVVALVAVLGLAGCRPIVLDANGTTSFAHWRVVPATVNGKDGIEVRIRDCATLVIPAGPGRDEFRTGLRPFARVTDATGRVLFNTSGHEIGWVQPAGSQVFGAVSQADDLQRIVVPVAGAKGAITVKPGCTTYPGSGMGTSYTWDFTPCTTTTRACATQTEGSGALRTDT